RRRCRAVTRAGHVTVRRPLLCTLFPYTTLFRSRSQNSQSCRGPSHRCLLASALLRALKPFSPIYPEHGMNCMSEGLNASSLPEQDVRAAKAFLLLVDIMAKLRDPRDGCPWDIAQTFESIAPYTIEEAYEVAEAIAQGDRPALCEELGDLALQVVYHARMAEEEGAFTVADVLDAINAKMIRRHPHVFGDSVVRTAEEQTRNWEEVKAQERAAKAATDHSALDGVATALPALLRAQKIQSRAARVGFDWRAAEDVVPKIHEEVEEIREAVATGDPDRIE